MASDQEGIGGLESDVKADVGCAGADQDRGAQGGDPRAAEGREHRQQRLQERRPRYAPGVPSHIIIIIIIIITIITTTIPPSWPLSVASFHLPRTPCPRLPPSPPLHHHSVSLLPCADNPPAVPPLLFSLSAAQAELQPKQYKPEVTVPTDPAKFLPPNS
jgi:hypothetical protein